MRTIALVTLAGCALTTRGPARDVHYYTPEHGERAVAPAPADARLQLRLGHVTATGNLRHAIVHRDSSYEVQPYETLRWTEAPDAYVRRALERALFDDRPITQAVSGDVPTLEVEVTAFEELRTTQPAGRVTLDYELRDDTAVLQRGTITITRPATAATIQPVVAAISSAMTAATSELADRVEGALRAHTRRTPDEREAAKQ